MPDIWMDVDAALLEVPVNLIPLIDDTDFKTREVGITYDQAGMDLVWNFVTTAGAFMQTAVTPTTGGDYDWAHQGDGMYTIEITASGGVSINNDTEGFGWFTGYCTGVLPWRGPVVGFRAAGLNNALIDAAYSATRGLVGTALPAAAADAAGGVPISDAGGLDLDTKLANTNEVTAARMGVLTDWINAGRLDAILDTIAADAARLTAARAAVLTDWINGGRLDLLLDAVKERTDNLPDDPADDSDIDSQLAIIAAYLDTEIGAILSVVNAIKAVTDVLPNSGALTDIDTGINNLETRLTAARGGYLDELAAANIPADIDTLLSRLSAARAGYLDELAAANLPADVDTLKGYCDKIDDATNGLIAIKAEVEGLAGDAMRGTNSAALASVCTEARLAELAAANLPSDVDDILTDTGTDGVKLADDAITSAKYDESTAFPVSSSMKKAGSTIIEGTVSWDNTNATTTIFYSDDVTEATADHYNGRIVIFTSGALLGQASDITDYELVAGEGKFTVTALTEPPEDNVTFVIV